MDILFGANVFESRVLLPHVRVSRAFLSRKSGSHSCAEGLPAVIFPLHWCTLGRKGVAAWARVSVLAKRNRNI